MGKKKDKLEYKTDKDKNESRKKEKLNTDYCKALDEVSDIEFAETDTQIQRLYKCRQVLVSTLTTLRGSFLSSPTQSTASTIARLVGDIRDMEAEIADALDLEDLVQGLNADVFKPFIERTLLELGQSINDIVDKYGTSISKKKALKRYFNEMYRVHGANIENKLQNLENKSIKYVKSYSSD